MDKHSYFVLVKTESGCRGGGLVCKVFAMQAWGPVPHHLEHHYKMSGGVVPAYNHSSEGRDRQITEMFWTTSVAQLVSLSLPKVR